MHIHILKTEEFNFTVISTSEYVDWEEIIDNFIEGVLVHG